MSALLSIVKIQEMFLMIMTKMEYQGFLKDCATLRCNGAVVAYSRGGICCLRRQSRFLPHSGLLFSKTTLLHIRSPTVRLCPLLTPLNLLHDSLSPPGSDTEDDEPGRVSECQAG